MDRLATIGFLGTDGEISEAADAGLLLPTARRGLGASADPAWVVGLGIALGCGLTAYAISKLGGADGYLSGFGWRR